jgi:transposase-like protein
MTEVAAMLKAIHAQESKEAAREKAQAVVRKLQELKLKEAAKKVEAGIEETLVYMDFPYAHWPKIRTNNVIERLNREIRRRTRVVGAFPDGNSALMLVCLGHEALHEHEIPRRCGYNRFESRRRITTSCQMAIHFAKDS